jgi:hypothetical protein
LRVWLISLTIVATLLTAGQSGGGEPLKLVELCLPASALGLVGHAPHSVAALWWNGTHWVSTPLYVEAVAVNFVYAFDLNKSVPNVGRAVVMPPGLQHNTKLCMYLPSEPPRGRPAGTPRAWGRELAGVYAEVEHERGARYHLFIAAEMPSASPANLSKARVNARVVNKTDTPPKQAQATQPGQTGQPHAGLHAAHIEPPYASHYATSLTLSYIGSFKLVKTDKYTASWVGGVAGGSFELPPDTYAMEVVITAASTPGLYYEVVVGEKYPNTDWTYRSYYVYLSSSAPYVTIWHAFSSSDAKRVYVGIAPIGYSGIYTVDAFVVVYGDAKGYWQRFHIVEQPVSGWISVPRVPRSDGYYIVFPGFTAPPGTAYTTTQLSSSFTICGSVGDYVNIYWGTTYVTRVYRQSASGDCKTFVVNTWVPPYENVKTGGSTHHILIGPVGGTVQLTIRHLAIYGSYRPEINRETSRVWQDMLTWGYAAYTSNPGRIEVKIYDVGSGGTESMRLAVYLSPYQHQTLCNTFRIRLALNNGINTLAASTAGLYVEGDRLESVISLLLGWVAQLFGTMAKILEKIGTAISWILLAKDTVAVLSTSSISTTTVDNYLDVYVNLGALDVYRPAMAKVVMTRTYSGDYTVAVKEVYMCGILIYSDTSSIIPTAQYHKPVSFISSTATQLVDTYRTLTCGKQEDLFYYYFRNEYAGEVCRTLYYR